MNDKRDCMLHTTRINLDDISYNDEEKGLKIFYLIS